MPENDIVHKISEIIFHNYDGAPADYTDGFKAAAQAVLDSGLVVSKASFDAVYETWNKDLAELDIVQWKILDLDHENAEGWSRAEKAEAALERVRKLADDWAAGRAPTAAAELRRAIEGGGDDDA